MNGTQTGLIAGLILGLVAVEGGFTGFLVALVVGAIGLVVGRVMEGELEIGDFIGRGKDR